MQGYSIPRDIPISYSNDQAIEWAYLIREKDIAWPVTIRFDTVRIDCPEEAINLNTGSYPQNGQTWPINRYFLNNVCRIHLDDIQKINEGYRFLATVTENFDEFQPQIVGTTPRQIAGKMNGAHPMDREVSILYDQEPPKGVLTILFTGSANLPSPWQVKWAPTKNP